ncbi:hypothetical protein [Humibacter sp. RRB41]|uniref:hypothetical protein n=1 Tax=Humibacter sp. RRB41 TaxID=2919946 RepID=UPI001FAA6847|nr:hypothetical protein [Humibacter sp. RRB41]
MPTTDASSDVDVLSLLDFDLSCEMHPSDMPECQAPAVGVFRCLRCGVETACSQRCFDLILVAAARARRLSQLLTCTKCEQAEMALRDLFEWLPFGSVR